MVDNRHISSRVDADVAAWLDQDHINKSATVNAALRAYIGDDELAEFGSDE